MATKMKNPITLKFKYICDSDLYEIIKSYNNLLHFTYNRLLENPRLKTSEITVIQKTINKPDYIMSHLMNSAIYDSKTLINKSKTPIIFGGKNLFKLRCKNKISHEEFVNKRQVPLMSVGEANQKANRLFTILDENTILFKLTKNRHFIINIKYSGYNYLELIRKLIELQNNKGIAITYKISSEYIYLTFDYKIIENYLYTVKENRVMAIDLNPNRVGYSIVDWKNENDYKIIETGSFSLKPLNDYQNSLKVSSDSKESKYITNKRKHEVIDITKQLAKLCRHYKCEVFAIEELNMKSKDKGKGKAYNKLCNNQWNRNLLVNQIKKRINSSSTIFWEVNPAYTTVLGNIVFRNEKLPDEVLSSVEIGRRGLEYLCQFIFRRRPHKKNIIFPDFNLVKSRIFQSLEELDFDVPNDISLQKLCYLVKKSGDEKYRFSLSNVPLDSLFSKFYKQKYLKVYTFI